LGEGLIPEANTYTLSPGSEVFTFSVVNGMIPLGTSLNQISPRVAVLNGTPFFPGVYTFTIMAVQDSNLYISVKVTDTLNVFGMVTASLPDGTVGTAYSDTQLVTAGGTAPITFTLVGSLPDGLTMTPAGLISGTPTADGIFDFTVQFTDAAGGTCEQDMTIEIISTFNWNLVWDVVDFSTAGTATASGTTGANAFSFDLHGASDSSGSAVCDLHSSMMYTGPAANCNLDLNLLQITSGGGGTTIVIQVLQDGVPILTLLNNGITFPLGHSSYPFTTSFTNRGPDK
jgi:hypothetical protein